jgi:hypothetical protein
MRFTMKTLVVALLVILSVPATAESKFRAIYAPNEPQVEVPKSTRINPTITAQKYMRTVYRPSYEDLMLEELRRQRMAIDHARVQAAQQRALLQRQIEAMEQARRDGDSYLVW